MNWFIGVGSKSYGLSPGVTSYSALAGSIIFTEPTEANVQVLCRDSYNLSRLFVNVISNTLDGATTVTSRINGADGNQQVSIGAGLTGNFQDAINSDDLVDGDLVDTATATAGTSGTIEISTIAYKLNSASDATILCASASGTIGSTLAGDTYYGRIGGEASTMQAEANAKYTFRTAATLSNLRVYVESNNLNAASTVRLRINGANGNQTISIGAAATGAFEDTTNTDSISAGDQVNWRVTAGGTQARRIAFSIVQMKSSSIARQVMMGGYWNTPSVAKGQTQYAPPESSGQSTTPFTTTESDAQCFGEVKFVARNLFVRITSNTLDGASTIRTRNNGANGNLSVSIDAAATGAFEDTTNFDAVGPAGLYNYQIVTGGTTGSLGINIIGFELHQGVGAKAMTTSVLQLALS